MKGEVLRAYVEQRLAPTLQPGDVVILDTLSAHKVDGVCQAIEARSTEPVCLTPYSFDLNLIEHLFAKLKGLLRKTAARTDAPAGNARPTFRSNPRAYRGAQASMTARNFSRAPGPRANGLTIGRSRPRAR